MNLGDLLSTSTKTVLFTDLEDYTASVSEMDRAQLHVLIEEHETKVASVLEKNGGLVVKNIGDSFLSIFDSATDAIKAGLALLSSLQDDPDFNVRVGIATGDVEEISGDYFGACVNLASRILSQAPAEEIWFSQSTFLSMNGSEIAWDQVGLFFFKGFFQEMPVYRAVSRHLFSPSEEYQKIAADSRVVVYRDGDPVPLLSNNDVVVVLNPQTDQKGQDAICLAFSSVSIHRIWLCSYYISPKDRYSWLERGGKWLISDEQSAEQSLSMVADEDDFSAGFTIILERDRPHLSLSGLALPRPPIADVIGYRYYFDRKGRWSSQSKNPLLSIQVSKTTVLLHVLSNNVQLDRKTFTLGQECTLNRDMEITVHEHIISYIHIGNRALWGILDGVDECRLLLEEGERIELGREFATSTFSLRNSKRQSNLMWASTPQSELLKKQGFTLERGLVGRKQVVVEVAHQGYSITQLHPHCPSHIIDDGNCTILQHQKQYQLRGLQKLVLGTNVFSILFQ
jgi:class 3 adenylate cyclase